VTAGTEIRPARLTRGLGRVLAFLMAGGLGFAVDAGVLWLLTARFEVDPFAARLAAIAVAVATTWLLNRRFTFAAPNEGAAALAREGARYGTVAAAGSAVNYAVYAAALVAAPGMPPLAALLLGSVVAMAFNYLGYARFVFGQR
jgi:putative flippase GtrA